MSWSLLLLHSKTHIIMSNELCETQPKKPRAHTVLLCFCPHSTSPCSENKPLSFYFDLGFKQHSENSIKFFFFFLRNPLKLRRWDSSRETLICSLNTWLIQKAGHSERIFSASCAFLPSTPSPLPPASHPSGFFFYGEAALALS